MNVKMDGGRLIYMDNAATTRMCDEALEAMLPYLTDKYGNASSIHSAGREAADALRRSRTSISEIIGASPGEVYFTGSGTESDNWAVRMASEARKSKGRHIITSAFEHHAVLNTFKSMEKDGWEVTYLDVHENGIVRPEDLESAIRNDTVLISVMHANNEIGTIQPIGDLGQIARSRGVFFHTDAVQTLGHIPVDVRKMRVDSMSFSAHKFNGPKGVGGLYIRKGASLPPLLTGGEHERRKRAGTENVAGIAGMAAALRRAAGMMDSEIPRLSALRDKLIDGLLKIPHTCLNGDRERRVPGNVNISVRYIEGESILLMLDMNNICASSGSACTTGSLDPSHVLLAIGLSHEVAHGSVRFSLGDCNTEDDVSKVLEVFPKVVERLREMSPLYDKRQTE